MVFGISCKDFLTIRSVSAFFAGFAMPNPNTLRAVSEVVCSLLVLLPIFSGDLGIYSSKTYRSELESPPSLLHTFYALIFLLVCR